jgi:putative membrane-bound dehydrogenase-like protein
MSTRYLTMGGWLCALLLSVVSAPTQPADIRAPEIPANCPPELRTLRPGVTLTEVVANPAVMTPTGIDVDRQGRIWAVSTHTHFRPTDYSGPKHDSVIVYADRDGDGRHESSTLFYEQTDATMDLELGPDNWVYLAERDRILRVRDTDGDGRGDEEEDIAVLQTTADYPHNGHGGLAWHPSGDLIFALGENMWKEWTLTGRDGTRFTGSGEGGIFRCRPDGSKLRRIAKGFWNPFGICVRPDGEIFAAENDPGSRPPCRLLHIVEGGDYGYQRLYGRAPFHPFVAWNGELRGTLPMVSPTGEAPCGIAPLGGGLLVPSWADNRIDFFPLVQQGASYTAARIEIATGSEFFRPTCIKQASAFTYYLTDWVFGSYEIHGKGRIWKLEIDPAAAAEWLQPAAPATLNKPALLARRLRSGREKISTTRLFGLAADDDPFLAHAAIQSLAARARFWDAEAVRKLPAAQRVNAVLALRVAGPDDESWPRRLLGDENPDVVFEALRWIADRRMASYEDEVAQLLGRPDLDYRLFEAALACWNAVTGKARSGVADLKMLLRRIRDKEAAPQVRAYALRLLPETERLSEKELRDLVTVGNPELAREAVRTLAGRTTEAAFAQLTRIADDPKNSGELRADAVVGLARDADRHVPILVKLAGDGYQTVRQEALRALRFLVLAPEQKNRLSQIAEAHKDSRALVRSILEPASLAEGRPELTDLAAWKKRIGGSAGNPQAGRRIFFHPRVALCGNCHRHSGRGVVLGPDLSAVADREGPDWLLHAILRPGKDVAPQFYPWSIRTKDGEDFVGIMLRKGGRSGKEFYRDPAGREKGISKSDIVSRRELKSSLMPEGLLATLTDSEIRDLLAFLNGK